jgi:hypothetical protein
MISSQELQQKLQAGQIHEALALVMQAEIELDLLTRIAEDLANSQSSSSEHLHPNISLPTENIQNAVGKNTSPDPGSYVKLKQLDLDRITASHHLVRGYLDRIQSILAALPPMTSGDLSTIDRHNSPPPILTAPAQHQPSDRIDLDENLDLSIDRDGEVWEEWVEDEDFQLGIGGPQPPSVSPILTLLNRQQNSIRRQLNPIEVKPIAHRSTSTPIDTSATWDKFVPEYIGIDAPAQPRLVSDSDADRMDELLADLDI